MPRLRRLGHALIDRQHQRLAALGTVLAGCVRHHRPSRAVLTAFLRATERHFASEERLMHRVGYPDLAGHQALHLGVLREITATRRLVAEGGQLHRRHIDAIEGWLAHHIDAADRNLVEFLSARRAAPASRRVRR
jgi:hemerythrin